MNTQPQPAAVQRSGAIVASVKAISNSRNGQLNIVLLILFAAGALYGYGEDLIAPIFAAGVSLWGLIAPVIRGTRKIDTANISNALTYVLSALVMALPWIEGVADAIPSLIQALQNGGSLLAALPVAIPLLNELVILFTEKPWAQNEEE